MTSTEIILACTHAADSPCDVTLSDGREVKCCCECWNLSVAARRAADKARNEAAKEEGRKYWQARNIAVGEVVVTGGISIFGAYEAKGIAKVGRVGAYVSSKRQRGFLKPEAFAKMAVAA